MKMKLIDTAMLEQAIYCNTDASEQDAKAIVNTVLYKQAMPHGGECLTDKASMTVCEGMYADKCDDVNGLCEALRAVLALAGEDPNVRKIVEDAIAEHGA